MTNSADPDQLASSEANGSGSTLFAKTGHDVFSKRRVKSPFRTIFPACIQKQSTYQCCQCFDFFLSEKLVYRAQLFKASLA